MASTREDEAKNIIASVDSNLYKVLGVTTDADEAVIKLAYRKLALRFHPDKNKSNVTPSAERAFKAINLAFQILSDSIARERYDALGMTSDEVSGATFCRTDVMKFCAQLKGANIEQLLELYMQALDMKAVDDPAAATAATVASSADSATKGSSEEGEEASDVDADADVQEAPSALLHVLSKADSGGSVMAAMTVAIFLLYYLTAV